MLLMHKPRNHKLLTLGITSIRGIGALLGLSALTYTPEISHADSAVGIDMRTLSDIDTMQEMTGAICHRSGEEEN